MHSSSNNSGPSSSSEKSPLLQSTSSQSPDTSHRNHPNDDASSNLESCDNLDSSLSDHHQCDTSDSSECSSVRDSDCDSLDSSDDELSPIISSANIEINHSTSSADSIDEPRPNSSTSLHVMGTTRDHLNSSSCSTSSTHNESSSTVMTGQGN